MTPGGNGLEREADHLAVFADRLTRSQRAKSELVAQRNVFESLYRGGLVLTLDLYDVPRAQRSQCGQRCLRSQSSFPRIHNSVKFFNKFTSHRFPQTIAFRLRFRKLRFKQFDS